jgi:hypothetical protein
MALKQMDRSRQARGRMLERAGHGPQPTVSIILHAEPGLNLRRYGTDEAGGPPVLLVPAPIKRAYIWDLAPEVSVVRRWLEQGYRVYLAEWTPLADADDRDDLGLADYADRLLTACRQAIAADGAQSSARSSPAIRWAASWRQSTAACIRTSCAPPSCSSRRCTSGRNPAASTRWCRPRRTRARSPTPSATCPASS